MYIEICHHIGNYGTNNNKKKYKMLDVRIVKTHLKKLILESEYFSDQYF